MILGGEWIFRVSNMYVRAWKQKKSGIAKWRIASGSQSLIKATVYRVSNHARGENGWIRNCKFAAPNTSITGGDLSRQLRKEELEIFRMEDGGTSLNVREKA